MDNNCEFTFFLKNPILLSRVSKNPEKSETRPDQNFSGFQMSGLRNLSRDGF